MDFNVNGVIDRNDAFLLARANLDMVGFISGFHVTTPDHQNQSTDCTLEIMAKLSTRAGNMATDRNTQVFFEFASEEDVLSSQLRKTTFDTGELVTTYNKANNLFGGVVKAVNQDGDFKVRAQKSQIESSNVGVSMIQVIQDSQWLEPVVTPLFMYSSAPRFPSPLRVNLLPRADMVLNNGHSPQLTINITESYLTCQDPPVTKNVMLVFRNDYTQVQGKEESFIENLTNDLICKYSWIKVKNMRLAPGSVLVYFDVITHKSRINDTLVALWNMVKSGYTLHVDDTEYQTKPAMRVNGQDYQGNDKPFTADDNSKFPLGAVVGVSVVVAVVLIAAVVFFCYKKRVFSRTEAFKWKSASKINILDSRSTSRMSNQTLDHEMVRFSGLYNDHFDYSDGDVSPSPGSSARNSFALILKPEENLAKRKLRKVQSTSSQVSIEAWTDSSSPALARNQFERTRDSTQPAGSSAKAMGPSQAEQLLRKQTSDSQLLMQQNSSTEGSPLDLSPKIPKRIQSLDKRILAAQNGFDHVSSDSSDEELVRSDKSSAAGAHSPNRKPLTPHVSDSKVKDRRAEAFVFGKAVLYKRMKSQESGSKISCKLCL